MEPPEHGLFGVVLCSPLLLDVTFSIFGDDNLLSWGVNFIFDNGYYSIQKNPQSIMLNQQKKTKSQKIIIIIINE